MLKRYLPVFTVLFFIFSSSSSWGQFRIGVGAASNANTDPKELVNYGEPKKYLIGGIEVTGVKFLDPNTLISVSGLSVNSQIEIPGEAISSAIRRLMAQGIIEEVAINVTKIEGNKVFLEINLKERPRLNKITLEGIRKGEIETVDDKIKENRGKVITEALVKNIQLTIKKHYIDKGFLNTTVQVKQIDDTIRVNNATLVFNIKKNDKVKIDDIHLTGIEELPEWKVLAKLKKTKVRAPLRIFTPSKFVPKQFKEDKKALVDWLHKKGYRNAQIVEDSVVHNGNDNVEIYLSMNEGHRFYYRDITWSGNYLHASDTLAMILGIKKGDLYNPEELEKKINGIPQNDVSSFYMDDGYLYFSCTPVEVAVEGDSIDIEMRIFEGKQAMINRIILNGNTKTSDHVVYREILTKPGQKFSKTDLIETTQMLSKLGYFDPQKIEPAPKPQADGTVDIEYNVEEKSNDQIELSGGWGGPQGLVGTFGIVFNNFAIKDVLHLKKYRPLPKGDGQRFSIRIQANGGFQNYSVSFTEPWLGGKKPNSFSVSFFHSVQDYGKLQKRIEKLYGNSGYNPYYGYGLGSSALYSGYFKNTGGSITYGKRLNWPDRNFSFSSSLSYQFYDVKNSYLLANFRNGQAHDISLSANISRYSLDNPQFTRSGSSIVLNASFNPPYSLFGQNKSNSNTQWIEGHKWMFDADWYTPVVGKLVLHAKANMGFLGRYSQNVGYSPFGRFVLGGAGMGLQNNVNIGVELIGLRGYNEGIVHEKTYAEQTAEVTGQTSSNSQVSRQGGIIYNKYTAELRYPVSLNPSATIYALSFLEAGNSWGSYKDFNPFKLRRSAGIGVRVFMAAFGLLGFDYGYGFDPIPGVQGKGLKRFTFSIGQQIR
ncbi:outer membrane protein assembly factor BamA [Marinilongibacter aquaticus]|uniref:outer membrane protein assembly factor BamA n=1 Tax=Marinilongibacter aquaticus TaxID=2975157 RepID=UPI0021BD6276|nr:outer membrane protein assembly factor BamA [Marinilongibacter aquaticus]UBM60098.1 outer membrane protein assembly factor BamA [Marinilongibacter aquaticus]